MIDHARILAGPTQPRLLAAGDQLLAEWRAQADRVDAPTRSIWVDGLRLVERLREAQLTGTFDRRQWRQDARSWPSPTYGAVVTDLAGALHCQGFEAADIHPWLGGDELECLTEVLTGLLSRDAFDAHTWVDWASSVAAMCSSCRVNAVGLFAQALSYMGIGPDALRQAIDMVEHVTPRRDAA